MKERCPRQHRMGETCGAKLVHHESVTKSDQVCKLCQEIQVKKRRLRKESDNIHRWEKEGNKFSASIEKAQRESDVLREQIDDLESRRPSEVMRVHGQARGLGAMQPPASSRPSQASHSANGYPASAHVHGNPNRHSMSSGSVSGGGLPPSNRHTAPHPTVQPTTASTNRHTMQYASSRR